MSICFQIARNTFRECVREPIYLLVLLSALSLIGVYPIFTLFVFREQVKLVVDSCMATMMVFGWVTAVLSASHAIAREIGNGTVLLLLAKPVRRSLFVVAKMLGILAALAVFCFLTAVATLLAVRVAKDQFSLDNKVLGIYFGAVALSCAVGGLRNYVARSSFPMATVTALLAFIPLTALGVYWIPVNGEQVGYSLRIVPALVLVLYSVWAMGALATMLSTRLDLVSNLTVCFSVFMVGLMSDYLIGRHASSNYLAAAVYGCVPNWQLFWMADALAAQIPVPVEYVLLGGAYISLLVCFFGMLAVALFREREVGQQSLS